MDIIEILDEIEKTYPPHQVAPDVTLDELSVIMDQYPGMVGRIKATEQRHLTKLIRERLDEQNEVELKSFCNCKFPEKRGFIESGSHVGDHEHGRHNVSICMNCGKIHVHTYKNGEHYSVTFHIILPEQVAAIQKYIDLLAKEDEMANYGRE